VGVIVIGARAAVENVTATWKSGTRTVRVKLGILFHVCRTLEAFFPIDASDDRSYEKI
jgi:hypothetical protein